MLENVDVELLESALDRTNAKAPRETALDARALGCARRMILAPGIKESPHLIARFEKLGQRLQTIVTAVQNAVPGSHVAGERHCFQESVDLLRSELAGLHDSRDRLIRTMHVRCPNHELVPRVLVIAEDMLDALNYCLDDFGFGSYLQSFQGAVVLQLSELWEMMAALKLVLLERITELVNRNLANEGQPTDETAIKNCTHSLREIEQTPWKELLEPLIVFDKVLREDPAETYAHMDADTRQMYRQAVVKIAECSEYSELEVAHLAVSLARQSLAKRELDPRLAARQSHVGYYLIAEGRELLYRRANVRLSYRARFQQFLRRYPDDFYLLGIEILTAGMILAPMSQVSFSSVWSMLFTAAVLFVPCSQGAIEIMNYLTTSLLEPQSLPKLDFADGIPEDYTTLVVIPTLLLNEKQVRQLVKGLELRYLGNMSANLCFALLTDLADSAEQPREDDPLVELCGQLIRELNEKYAENGTGTFAMLHRHRVYNRREGVWMGVERKRGKLQDLNELIVGKSDSFPYKVGDVSILPRVRYVLTLDSDTELPRGAAERLVGTLAHPLCQPIIDRKRNIVTQGYGILQPRVGISVESAAQSRLASIYSVQTGLDLYTRAVSDVYQDLYGEGTFVGKGLYEVRAVHETLSQRFPRNTILSHDLIEGAYTRAGLVSDVEVIDHHPLHYSTYSRRKHRWVRGDWQIAEWLFSRVPDENGERVHNPISLISRWKILDNLRRSIVEPATLALFLLAWTILPGRPLYWTLTSLVILFAPKIIQLGAGLARALFSGRFCAAKNASISFASGVPCVLLNLVFLLHNALVCSDAIWRSLYRSIVSRERLLEWETAAETELASKKRTPLDVYLLCTPAIALIFGLILFLVRRASLWIAIPLLVLWGCSKLVSFWLDRPARLPRKPASRKSELLLRRTALCTWRYFAEYSTQEHHWLIPDNVQQHPPNLLPNISPTNLGLLLNARQVACEFGYLTVPEFAEVTRKTLDTMTRLQRHRGHLLNWYNTHTLLPIAPLFVSTVDSGNLAASLITLKGGCAALHEKPLISPDLLKGYNDHVQLLMDLRILARRTVRAFREQHNKFWLKRLFEPAPEIAINEKCAAKGSRRADARWFATELNIRKQRWQEIARDYMPWLLPEFDSVRANPAFGFGDADYQVPLGHLPGYILELQAKLRRAELQSTGSTQDRKTWKRLLELLATAEANAVQTIRDLYFIGVEAERWVSEMDFGFLLNRRRKLLVTGYDVEKKEFSSSCYDLLASEARIASFVAIAKNHIPQEAWFALGRAHAPVHGRPTLVSWTGTMFEYLMPAIWARSYPDTLLQRAMEGAVREQRAYAAKHRVPWGISESGYCEIADTGLYHYRAFGVPQLALQCESKRLVIAPYASTLALAVDATAAIKNLRKMEKCGWFGTYGFYEAADFTPAPGRSWRHRCGLVKAWMAHHQGMSLLSIANFLRNDIVQQWFHADACIQATELLLQECSVPHVAEPVWWTRRPVLSTRAQVTAAEELALTGYSGSVASLSTEAYVGDRDYAD